MRRLPGRCYFCGDPCVTFWFCPEHVWAQGLVIDPARGEDVLTSEHRWWLARFSREEIAEMGAHLERPMVMSR